MTNNINNTLNTIVNLLDEQKTLLADPPMTGDLSKVNLAIQSATRYSFESDGSVALSGLAGSVWVFPDTTVTPASTEPGTAGYPAYEESEHLARAKQEAREILGLFPLAEMFGRMAEHVRVQVENGTESPDYRDVYYFLDSEDVYNSGYRSGGNWTDGWWS